MKKWFWLLIAVLALILASGCREGQKSIEKARDAEEAGRYAEAAELYRTAISQGENGGEVYADLALVEARRLDYEAADRAMETALSRPDAGRSVRVKAGVLAFLEGKYEDAVRLLSDGLPADEEEIKTDADKTALAFLAESHKALGDPMTAVSYYKRMILAKYKTLDAKLGVGVCYMALHERSAAATYFDYALEETDVRPEHYLLIYRSAVREGDYLAGERYFQAGLSSATGKDGRMTEGEYYASAGKFIAAAEKLTTDDSTGAKIAKASLAVSEGRYSDAEALYTELLAENKALSAVYNQYMILKIREGRFDVARDLLKQARSLNDPAYTETLDWNEIMLEEAAHEYKKAYELLSEYVKVYGETPEAEREKRFISRILTP